jgi:dTDP-4-dehydrorhamnose 3,5-epimerase
VKPQTIPVHQGDIAQGFARATELRSPLFVPAATYCDDRGWSIMNQFHGVLGPDGQINFSCVYPNVVKAWHRHRHQTDFWIGVGGHIKVGVCREDDGRLWQLVTGEMRPGIVIIPPPLWHGVASVGPTSAQMFYYVTKAYDPAHPDEERRPFDSFPDFNWGVEHR